MKKGYTLETTIQLKKELDLINYRINDVDIIKDFKSSCSYLKQYYPSNSIKNDVNYILDAIKKYNSTTNDSSHLHLGAISSGAHSLDYANYYGFEIDDDWNFNPILFVYECPSANLDASFLGHDNNNLYNDYKKLEKNRFKNNLHKLLGDRIWHADYGWGTYNSDKENSNQDSISFGDNNFSYFGSYNYYSEFLLSLILEFKLGNFYTTNFFRYELFKSISNNKEKALNLGAIDKLNKNENLSLNTLTNTFEKEYETLDPTIVFATSNPFQKISYHYKVNTDNKPKLFKIPHPTGHFTNKQRFSANTMIIISGLKQVGIINAKTANNKMIHALKKIEEV